MVRSSPLPDTRTSRSKRAGLPVPPKDLWLGYGWSPEEYIRGGREDVESLRRLVSGVISRLSAEGGAILDFGCGAGRMIRHLEDLTPTCRIWGVDISEEHVAWCEENLSPPFHFMRTTAHPHLPFEDRTFDLVYAGSVFTHISDLATAWFDEMGRILVPGGTLYATIHDIRDLPKTMEKHPDDAFVKRMSAIPEIESIASEAKGQLVFGEGRSADVFYERSWLERLLLETFPSIEFVPEAYGYQTAMILRKP